MASNASSPGEIPPAVECRGIWKLFGHPRRVAAAAVAVEGGAGRAELLDRYGVFAAVAGVDLEVYPREILCIVGLSGSGKSTLICHLNRLVDATLGQVLIGGADLAAMGPQQLLDLRSRHVGMIFQQTSLFPHRRVIDNVAYGLEIRGVPKAARYAAARQWLKRMHLSECEDHYPAELSGGMQQRVGLARTFITDPDVLLLDEPFSALDPIIRGDLQDQFTQLCRDLEKTAVFITHDFAEAVRIADRIGVMKDGKIIQIGAPRDIVLNPASDYVAKFSSEIPKLPFLAARDLLAAVPQEREKSGWRSRTAALADDAPLAQVLSILCEEDAAIPIIDERHSIVGTITREGLLRFMQVHAPEAATLGRDKAGAGEDAPRHL